jgi:hypothetical protein
VESEDGGRTGDMSTSRPGSDAAELTSVELIAARDWRRSPRGCWDARGFSVGWPGPAAAAAETETEDAEDGFLPKSRRSFARAPVRPMDAAGAASGRWAGGAVITGGLSTTSARLSPLSESARGGTPTIFPGWAGGGGAAAFRFFFTVTTPSSGGCRGRLSERLPRGEDDKCEEDRSSSDRLVRGAGTGSAAAVLPDMF